MAKLASDLPKGMTERHARACATRTGGRCNCAPGIQAQVWDPVTQRRVSKTFSGRDAIEKAAEWMAERRLEISRGTFRPGRQITMRQAFEELLEDMRAGIVRNRSGETYKPSVVRGYERDIRKHLLPVFGTARPADIRGADVQRVIGRLEKDEKAASTIRNILMPMRVLYRRLLRLEEIAASPMVNLELPAVRGRRLRIAPPEEAAALIAALPAADAAIWATAMYAGLRLGELEALDVADLDLATGVISVEWNWDPVERKRVRPKSAAGERSVPVPAVLRDRLLERRMSLGWDSGCFFGQTADEPLERDGLRRRAYAAWDALNEAEREAAEEAEREPRLLQRLTPHDCRHTYASFMIAAGVNPKALSTYMGHANISITLDRYGHLFPGNEEEAASLLDAYLERANTAARKAVVAE